MRTKPKIGLITIGLFLICTNSYAAELSEISFKDTKNDWIEITLEKPLTDSIIVKEDSIIAEISPEKTVSKKFVLVYFKSDEEKVIENQEVLEYYIKKSGLTGTTEQITIEQNNRIIDAVCWKNSTPPKSEQKDIEELKIECIDSDKVEKNQSIAKIKGEWGIIPHPTPKKENTNKNSKPTAKIDIQKGSTQGEIPFSINLDGSNSSDQDNDNLTYFWQFPDKTMDKKNPPSYRFETTGTYTITLTVTDTFGETDTSSITINASPKSTKQSKRSSSTTNGDLSNSIEITEIFPNPKGKDTGNEWIELYNSSNQNVDLSNWKINENKLTQTTIPANSYITIKQTLKNTANELVLKDFQNTTISQASYPKTKEGLSYSKIENKWFWSKPTKAAPNPIYTTLKARIVKPPTIAEDFYFTVMDETQKMQKITFDQDLHSFELLASIFKEGTEIELTIDENQNLIEYKIINNPKAKKQEVKKYSWLPYLLLGISTLVLIFIYAKPNTPSHYK